MKRSLWILMFLALPACGDISASVRMRTTPAAALAADPANATVVFLRPGSGGANALFDESGKALGEVLTGSKLVIEVPPGPHTFIKAMYTNSAAGDFSLYKGIGQLCSSVSGALEAGKIYFVEVGLFKLFATSPDDPRLPKWTALHDVVMDASVGPSSVAADPAWSACVEGARAGDAKRRDQDKARFAGGVSTWPAQGAP